MNACVATTKLSNRRQNGPFYAALAHKHERVLEVTQGQIERLPKRVDPSCCPSSTADGSNAGLSLREIHRFLRNKPVDVNEEVPYDNKSLGFCNGREPDSP